MKTHQFTPSCLYTLTLILFCLPTNAAFGQIDSELKNYELVFRSPLLLLEKAQYGLDGITLHNFLRYARLNTDTLQIGGSTGFSFLKGDRLSIKSGLIVPSRNMHLGRTYLEFQTIYSSTNGGFETWSIERITKPPNELSGILRFVRYMNPFGGFPLIFTALSIHPDLNVGIGAITPSEKLDVDGNARFRDVPEDAWQDYLGIDSDGRLVRIPPIIIYDTIKEQQQMIEGLQLELQKQKETIKSLLEFQARLKNVDH